MGNRPSYDDSKKQQMFASEMAYTGATLDQRFYEMEVEDDSLSDDRNKQHFSIPSGGVCKSAFVKSRKPGLRISQLLTSGLADAHIQQEGMNNILEKSYFLKRCPRFNTMNASREDRRRVSEFDRYRRDPKMNTANPREIELHLTDRNLSQIEVAKKPSDPSLMHLSKNGARGDNATPSSLTSDHAGNNRLGAPGENIRTSAVLFHAASSEQLDVMRSGMARESNLLQGGPHQLTHLKADGDTPDSSTSGERDCSEVQIPKVVEPTHGCSRDLVQDKNNNDITQKTVTAEAQLLPRSESMQSLGLLIESLKNDIDAQCKLFSKVQGKLQCGTQQLTLLNSKLNASRSAGIDLESANGKFIAESMKNRYLQMELEQLNGELDRKKAQFDAKQLERRGLSQELERLKRQKAQYERHCKEAFLESKFTSEQLREITDKCKTMEAFRDEERQLLNMMCNLQAALGRVRVFGILKTTAHVSCVQYVSSSEIIFSPPSFYGLSHINNTEHISGGTPVRCKLSHIIPPGSCNALEVFNEVSTTLDGIVDGLNAFLVTVGPRSAGKSSTVFGELRFRTHQTVSPKMKRRLHTRELKAHFQRLSGSTEVDFNEFTRSVEFASLYGLLGLCLVHLLQTVNLKTIIDTSIEDLPNVREYRIGLAAVLVPLCSEKVEFDLIANDYTGCRLSGVASAAENEVNFHRFHLKYHDISNIADVLHVCDTLQRRLKRCSESSLLDFIAVHRVIIVDVHTVTEELKTERRTTAGGVVVFADTFGFEHDIMNSETAASNTETTKSMKAWNDVSVLIQAMRTRVDAKYLKRSSLLRVIQSCVFQEKSLLPTVNCSACVVLLHLPCDINQAYVTMQCLRLGLWVLHLKQNKCHTGRSVDGSNGSNYLSDISSKRGTCFWKIGFVGCGKDIVPNDSIGSRKHCDYIGSAVMRRSNSLHDHADTIFDYKMGKQCQSMLQRTSSIS